MVEKTSRVVTTVTSLESLLNAVQTSTFVFIKYVLPWIDGRVRVPTYGAIELQGVAFSISVRCRHRLVLLTRPPLRS